MNILNVNVDVENHKMIAHLYRLVKKNEYGTLDKYALQGGY